MKMTIGIESVIPALQEDTGAKVFVVGLSSVPLTPDEFGELLRKMKDHTITVEVE